MSDLKDASGAPEVTDSVETQEHEAVRVSDAQDTVKYDTYRRTLSEAKKAKASAEEYRQKLAALETAKLEEEGKWREAYERQKQETEDAKRKYAETMGGVVKGNAMAAILDEARKAGFQGSRNTLEALVSDKLSSFEYDEQLRPVQDAVLAAIKEVKQVEPRLFGTEAPKVANHNVNPYSGVDTAANTPMKNMKDEDLMSLWEKADTNSRRLK